MRIQVTKEHIERGERENCWKCPIALAFAQAGITVSVGERLVRNIDLNTWGYLPQIAQDFIRRFDAGEPVEPFEFEVEL